MHTNFEYAAERPRSRERSKESRMKVLNRKLRNLAFRGQDTTDVAKELNGIYRNLYRLRMKG